MKISDLKPLEQNPFKSKGDSQIKAIGKSIKDFSEMMSIRKIVIDENNTVLGGNKRYFALKMLGYSDIPDEWIDKREGLTESQKREFIVKDNSHWGSEWDFEILQDWGVDLEEYGVNFNFEESSVKTEEIEEVEAEDTDTIKTDIQEGDIFQIGTHRLMCGDSTDYALVWNNLLENTKVDMCFTDPPYNTGMSQKSNKDSTRLNHMFSDSFTEEEWIRLMKHFTANIYACLKENSVAYICLDWRRNYELIPYIKKSGFHLSNTIVWDKVVHGLGSDYKYTYELINVCKKGKPELNTHQGDREYSDVWHIQRKLGKDEDHATKKPIEVCSRAIRHTKASTVIDIFGGSGSTMVACEQLNRQCYMMELDPKYCQVIINRMRKLNPEIQIKCLNRDFNPTE